MPTVEDLERLTALLKRLGPVADQRAGELIRADDWNLVVDAVIETARSLVEAEARGVEPHDHPDQVQIGWLDPRLRQIVEGGPLGDPGAMARVDALERADTKLTAALEQLRAELEQMRSRMRDVATRDLERESSVNVVRRKVEGIADGREDVLAVRAGLDAMRGRVGRAIELAEKLEVGGEPPDLGALDERVKAIEDLRERLTLPSGEPFDGATLERRLTELQATLVTEEELDQALEDRRAQLDPADRAAIEDGLRTSFEGDLSARDDALRNEIDTRTDSKLADVGTVVSRAVADATPGITDAAVARTRQELDARLPGVRQQAVADARAQLDARSTELRAESAAGLSQVRQELTGLVGSQVDQRLATVLPAIQQEMGGLTEFVKGLDGRLERTEATTGGLNARVEGLERRIGDDLVGLRNELTRAIDTRIADAERRFNRRFDEIDPRIDGRVNAALDERDTVLRKQLTTIARDEIVGLEDRLPTIIGKEIDRRPRNPREPGGGLINP